MKMARDGLQQRGRRGTIRAVLIAALICAATVGASTINAELAFASPSWSLKSSPNPSGSEKNTLSGVSCLTVAACVGVGYTYSKPAGKELYATLGEYWDGTEWTIIQPNNSTSRINELRGVSCLITACTAVGFSEGTANQAMIESWNGTEWSTQTAATLPAGGSNAQLNGVSCISAEFCTAVGLYTNSAKEVVTLAERWNGSAWSVQSTVNVSGGLSTLTGVSCLSTSFCVAVGYNEASGRATAPLIEKWNGTEWSRMTSAEPEHSTVLNAVSCPSSSVCVATGKSGSNAYAEAWNGTIWSTKSLPTPSGTEPSLLGVSCGSTISCTAVGWYWGPSFEKLPLAEYWNGEVFELQSTPTVSGAVQTETPGRFMHDIYGVLQRGRFL